MKHQRTFWECVLLLFFILPAIKDWDERELAKGAQWINGEYQLDFAAERGFGFVPCNFVQEVRAGHGRPWLAKLVPTGGYK